MKKQLAVAFAALLSVCSFAQKANVTWGDDFKLKRGSADLEVISSDNTGIYVKESHYTLKSYFVIGATVRESATLIKLDKNLARLYDNNFNKELKGKEYERFFLIKNKMYLLATDYNKKEKTLTLFGAEINKENGELNGDWIEITSWSKDDKKEDISFKAAYNSDSSKMVLVSTIQGREKNNYEIRQFDENLKPLGKSIAISNEFDPKTYSLEDVVYTRNDNVVMVGREYEYQEGKKKKNKYLDFKNYNIRVYDNAGKQVKEVNTTVNGKWLVSTKLAQIPANNELVLAAFYSNEKRGKEINGMLIQRINPISGDIISTTEKEINTAMITTLEDENTTDDGDDESRKERKERERLEKIQNEEDGFSKYMRFRNFIYTEDKGLVILAEKYNAYTYSATSYSPGFGNSPGTWRTTTYQVFECGDIMMSKMDAAGKLQWLDVVPKEQREIFTLDYSSSYSGLSFNSYFVTANNWPFYAGFGVLPGKNNVNLIFNDQPKNAEVLQLGQKVKRIAAYGKSDCYTINLNTATGKYTRSVLFNNRETPTAMPRLSSVLNNEMYLIGKEDRIFGKTKIAVAKLVLKD